MENCSIVGSIPYWDQSRAIQSFKANQELIKFLSVFWYVLDRHGEIRKYVYAHEDRDLVRYAQRHGTKVLALIANLPDDEAEKRDHSWDSGRVWNVIKNDHQRTAHVSAIARLLDEHNYDGVIIDYEALPGSMKKAYSEFIASLSTVLHKRNKLLAVALHPKTSELNPREDNGSHAQDWKHLQKFVDQMHFMTFGEHTADTVPGPVASPGWQKAILDYIVNDMQVPVEKVFFGIPLYGEAWSRTWRGYTGLDHDFTYRETADIRQKFGAKEHWSNEQASPYLKYTDDSGTNNVIWYENTRSFDHKLALGGGFGICNLTLWRLGGEDAGVWSVLRRAGY